MKIAIVGSREGFSKEYVYDILKTKITTGDVIITGDASGVDTYAEQYAKDNDIQCEIIRPINSQNKINYLYRNIEIITKADKIIAFWNGKSRGTNFVIDYAKARYKQIDKIFKTINKRGDKVGN